MSSKACNGQKYKENVLKNIVFITVTVSLIAQYPNRKNP